jgi:hypothetical protein
LQFSSVGLFPVEREPDLTCIPLTLLVQDNAKKGLIDLDFAVVFDET